MLESGGNVVLRIFNEGGRIIDMMRILKIYLETTMFNYYFDKERDAHADTVKLFQEIKAGKYQAFTSVYAVQELGNAPSAKRTKMLGLLDEYDITILETSDEAVALAKLYLEQGIIPRSNMIDAAHIAIATVYDMDMILSLNFKHIVRKKTSELTAVVNSSQGYRKIEIISPMEVVERE